MAQQFRDQDLTEALFHDVDLSRATFREGDLSGARMLGVVAIGLEIDGLVKDLVVNGVEVTGYVEAELDRRHPERLLLRSDEPALLREAWSWLSRHWDETAARVAALPEADQHRGVDDEWSAVETMRHLVFVTDSWFTRAVLGRAGAFHATGLASGFVPHQPEMGLDPTASPSLDEVLEVRLRQRTEVSDFLATVTRDDLAQRGWNATEPGWPLDPTERTILECLHTLLNEEWAHRCFCERDLDRLAAAG
jgi:hypothetical protein